MSERTNTILIAFVLPEDKGDWTQVEADDVADGFRDIINEEWERNGASRPGYYTPCEISGIPAPQWVTARSLAALRAASVLEGSTQPTRDELADAIVDDVKAAVFTAKGVREAALDAIDVLVARGWVGVSDTPNETQ